MTQSPIVSRRRLLTLTGTLAFGGHAAGFQPQSDDLQTVDIQTATDAGDIHYRFTTDESVYAATLPESAAAEPGGNDTVTRNPDGTLTVTGVTGRGKADRWLLAGDLHTFSADADPAQYTVLVDGDEYTPTTTPATTATTTADETPTVDTTAESDHAPATTAEPAIEFQDCSQFRIVGDFEAVFVHWGGYAEGYGRGDRPIDVGPVSGETTIAYHDVWPSHDVDRSDYFVFPKVQAYRTAPGTGYPEGTPDLVAEHPQYQACQDQTRPTPPTVAVRSITQTNTATFDVTFEYTNPNTIIVKGNDEFTAGTAIGTPPELLDPGTHTFTVIWTPEQPDEQLHWAFEPLGYHGERTVQASTPAYKDLQST